MRIIDAVAARWLVAEVELGGEFLAVCLQHLHASWKEAPHVQPREGPVGKKHLVSISKNGFSSALARPWQQTGPRSPAAAADLPPQSDQTEMMDRVIGTSEKHDFKINIV
ncbi:hypothetical protein PVAP13_5NG335942 [Panicum virgatum]|uniref:Uncharacterized protein n=1 Tax=Panicum virgatum TaxID=38727 RepID=A0A8T0RZ70_PANVG|nr:hypothetical protein PVAP13_5NG335942 [Panicum virgatum]